MNPQAPRLPSPGAPLPLHLKWGAMEPLRNAPQWTWVRSESWPPSVERNRYLDVIGDRWCFGAWIFLQMPSQELSRTQGMMILKTVNNYTTQKVRPYGNCGLALTVMQWYFNIGSSVLMRILHWWKRASQVVLVVKNLPANAGDPREVGLIPVLGRSPGIGNGNLLQYSCLGNPMDRGAWWATVHAATES